MRPPPVFETKRLRLRPPAMDDATSILREYAQDPDVTRYLSWRPHGNIEATREFLNRSLAALEKASAFFWVITLKGDDGPVGMIEMRIDGPRADLGYVLAKRFWSKGYMTEALEPLVKWALQQDDLYRVWAFCDVENRASARVLEKVGMQREGLLHRWFVHPNLGNVPRDCYCYAKVK